MAGNKSGGREDNRRWPQGEKSSRGEGEKRRVEKLIRLSDDLLWGVHPVYESLVEEPGRISEIILQKERHGEKIDAIIQLAKEAKIKLLFVESLRITGEGAEQIRHQGVVARTTEAGFIEFADFVGRLKARIEAKEPCRIVALDTLQDPHNVGAIIRSALASGAAGVLVTRERSAPLGGTAAKASAGAMSHIDICQVTNLVNTLKKLKEIGFWIFGAVKDDSAVNLYRSDLTPPACFVIGAEEKGVRPLVQKECDVLLSIPMKGEIDSLNASVAAGVILFEALRQNLAV
ncbi:MAG: 23S rRNA (guanosine(2251)-2'-O)-methyltransferase RlmB [Desulforhopalus sp.]|nr:23S rRNA (guanosine(2251)-2'-O)-methyltransferase RlmB [Desulforhopalus sp.]